ncbi:phage protease [Serratia marcescens]|uniref:Phage protease n=1 Tax=Serratia marcescens TaxID=615 RepID=A0ABD5BQM1_SERMA|nr:phage protease [Serratia marcescens]MBN3900792.1 phage protease [Serratia marcescens]MBN3911634.1 phage protease [Serratia marcescens]MBN3917467.1 phage protease [Serratia marcescens]MBN3933446.1 phage protease [Serratia marcescens]MBN3952978.1 phage protease [Serratia marcescens]
MKSPLRLAALSVVIENAGPRVQLFPAGAFRAMDGRPEDIPHWYIDAALAQVLIDVAAQRNTPYCFDYEHQTQHCKTNGKPNPAAGWFSRLEWVEGKGLFAVDVEWTEAARAMIEAKEYRFISPLFNYDAQGNVKHFINAALTNTPALDDMEALLAAASQQLTGENTVDDDELLQQLRWMLNLPLSSTADDIKAELQKLINRLSDNQGTAAASVNLLELLTQQDERIAALSAQTTDSPDPAKFVPVSVLTSVQQQLAALSQKVTGAEVNGLIQAALSDGRLLPDMQGWAETLGNKDIASLKAFLDKAPKVAALSAMQTGGKSPTDVLDKSGLDADALAVCSVFGHDPKDIAALSQEV